MCSSGREQTTTRRTTPSGGSRRANLLRRTVLTCALAIAALSIACASGAESSGADSPSVLRPITLSECRPPRTTSAMRCGTAVVFEDPERGGRELELAMVVIPSRSTTPRPDPVFYIAGGPGQTATDLVPLLERSPHRDEREIVVLDQRGTSAQQRLDCPSLAAPDDAQGYLAPMFAPAEIERCRAQLASRADLTQYTTMRAVEDLEAVRTALGYSAINLIGISYGTRVALMYARRHPSAVRTAVLSGLAPPELRNPLYHARGAQQALDSLLADCLAAPACRAAFPNLRAELDSVVVRLRRSPAGVVIAHPALGDSAAITFDATHFAEAMRLLMYTTGDGRWVPFLIHRASTGDLGPLAQAAVNVSRNIRDGVRRGMLMSVVCSEDVPRIDQSEIAAETRGTLLGDARVRQQMTACKDWPRGELPGDYAAPFTVPVPTLLVSGTRDPVTPVRWGEAMRAYFPQSLHLVVPGAHGVNSPCVTRIAGQLLRTGTTAGLDVSCTASERYGDFILP